MKKKGDLRKKKEEKKDIRLISSFSEETLCTKYKN